MTAEQGLPRPFAGYLGIFEQDRSMEWVQNRMADVWGFMIGNPGKASMNPFNWDVVNQGRKPYINDFVASWEAEGQS